MKSRGEHFLYEIFICFYIKRKRTDYTFSMSNLTLGPASRPFQSTVNTTTPSHHWFSFTSGMRGNSRYSMHFLQFQHILAHIFSIKSKCCLWNQVIISQKLKQTWVFTFQNLKTKIDSYCISLNNVLPYIMSSLE